MPPNTRKVFIHKHDSPDAEITEITDDNPFPVKVMAQLFDYSNIQVSGQPYAIQRAILNVAASQTDNAFVAAVTGRRIRVIFIASLAGGTATNLTFNTKGSGAGVAISPLLANGINGGEILPPNPYGWFETNFGEALTVTTGAGATTGILVGFIAV